MTPLEYFRKLATEFASMSDADVGFWLTMAENNIDVTPFSEERQNILIALYAAHLLTIKGKAALAQATGSITREKEGDLERAYAASSSKKDDSGLASTWYGVQYKALSIRPRIMVGNECYG